MPERFKVTKSEDSAKLYKYDRDSVDNTEEIIDHPSDKLLPKTNDINLHTTEIGKFQSLSACPLSALAYPISSGCQF